MNRRLGMASLLVLAFAACDRGEKAEPELKEVQVAIPTPAAGLTAAAPAVVLGDEPTTTVPDDTPPTEEDYETEAAKMISGENLDDALDELERQIGE